MMPVFWRWVLRAMTPKMAAHCCVLIEDVQYHCVPLRGCIRVLDQAYRKIMPTPVDSITFMIDRVGLWEENRAFDKWPTVWWRLGLKPRNADVANCVTCTCWLIGIDIPARTPQGLMNFLRGKVNG